MKKLLIILTCIMMLCSYSTMAQVNNNALIQPNQEKSAENINSENSSLVEIELNPVELNSRLKNQYSAFEYKIKNNSKNTIRIENTKIENGVTDSEKFTNSVKIFTPTTTALLIAAPFTFGLTALISIPFTIHDYSENKKAIVEASYYSSKNPLELRGEVINSEDNITFNVITQLNVQPKIRCVFQDIKTGEYFTIVK